MFSWGTTFLFDFEKGTVAAAHTWTGPSESVCGETGLAIKWPSS